MPIERLSDRQLNDFIHAGYLKLENAFPEHIAQQCRELLWEKTGLDPGKPEKWTKPVIRIGEMSGPAFEKAANTPLLHYAFDQLVGGGNWIPRKSIGSFPIRFPGFADPGDTGWHVDASFPGDEPADYLKWRINVHSRGRALLMLFLFSHVEEQDAPTRIRVGSHKDIARLLHPAGEQGLSFVELSEKLNMTAGNQEVLATGKAGTVYLCHPFIVHAAQPLRGNAPKFMAQPPLLLKTPYNLDKQIKDHPPVEQAILDALA